VSDHTPEPWDVHGDWISGNDGDDLARMSPIVPRLPEEQTANAKRIVLCVNACAGISDEELQSRVDRIAWLRTLKKRDKVLVQIDGQNQGVVKINTVTKTQFGAYPWGSYFRSSGEGTTNANRRIVPAPEFTE
jgi:hypothetical protein